MIEIIPLDGSGDIGVEEVLKKVKEDKLDYVLIIGQKGEGWYFASSDADAQRAVFSAEQFHEYMTRHM